MKKCLPLLLVLFLFHQVSGQWNPDPTVNNVVISSISSPAAKNDLVTTPDGLGNTFIVWSETRDASQDLFVQKLDVNGNQLFGPTGFTLSNRGGTESSVDIFPDAQGGVIVVWQDNAAGNNNIYAQRVNALGGLVWVGSGIPICVDAAAQTAPKVTLINSTEFVVVWRDTRDGLSTDLYANKFLLATGEKVWANDFQIVSAANAQTNQRLLPDGLSGFVVCWQDARTTTSTQSIYVQRVNAAGASPTKLWGSGSPNNGLEVSIPGAYTNTFPSLFTDGANGAVISFDSNRSPGSSTNTNLYLVRTNAAGEKWASGDLLICDAAGNQTRPTVVLSGSNFVVVWQDLRTTAQTSRDIYAQSVSLTGTINWAANGVAVCTAINGQPSSSTGEIWLVPDNIGGGVVIWDDARNTGNTDVMAQRLNPLNGAPLWALDGVPVANRTASNQSSSVVNPFGPDNTIVVVWLDNRDASVNNKIFASSLRSDGILPLTLITFDAVLQGSKIVTRWEITDELNTREFIVEKSSDGQRYYPIGSLQAKNLVGKHQYSLDDLRPLTGENYYRLRSVDKDGKFAYSRIARINLARQLPAVVFVSPNPAVDLVKVQLSNFTDGAYQLRLVDARGTVVQSRQLTVQGSLLQFNLNLSAMPAGRYWMQIVQSGKSVMSTQPIQKL